MTMSRELMGKIVDEVLDGAIEDASVIEQIYDAIKKHDTPSPSTHMRLDVDRLAARIVTAACELDGPADPAGDDTISITTKDLEAVVHRHVTAALENQP